MRASGFLPVLLISPVNLSVLGSKTVIIPDFPLVINPLPISGTTLMPCTPARPAITPTIAPEVASSTATSVPCETYSRWAGSSK